MNGRGGPRTPRSPAYQAYVHLTPVLGRAYRPVEVLPGSHRHRAKKVMAGLGTYAQARSRSTDLEPVHSILGAHCVLGDPASAIFTDHRLARAARPGHTAGTRSMIVARLYE